MTDIHLLRNCTPAANKHSLSRCVVVHILLTNLNEQVYITYRGSWYCGVCVCVWQTVPVEFPSAWWSPKDRPHDGGLRHALLWLQHSCLPVDRWASLNIHLSTSCLDCVCVCMCVCVCVCVHVNWQQHPSVCLSGFSFFSFPFRIFLFLTDYVFMLMTLLHPIPRTLCCFLLFFVHMHVPLWHQTRATSCHSPSSCSIPASTTPVWRTRPLWSVSSPWTEASTMERIYLMSCSRWEPLANRSAQNRHQEVTTQVLIQLKFQVLMI